MQFFVLRNTTPLDCQYVLYAHPPPDSMLGGIDEPPPPPIQCWERSHAQTRVQINTELGVLGVKLAQIVMYVH